MAETTSWLDRLRGEGFVGYSLVTGDLVREVLPTEFLPIEHWPNYRLHGYRHHSPEKLLHDEDVNWVRLEQLTAEQRAEFDHASNGWKRVRARYQRRFREAALRDLQQCANCGSDENLEAAHAIRSALEWTHDFDVEQAHHPILGVTLCSSCHRNFDRSKYDRDTTRYAATYAATEARVFERVARIYKDTTNPAWDLQFLLGEALFKARKPWAFDFSLRGIPMAAGWHHSEFLQVWVAPEEDREQEPPPSFMDKGTRIESMGKLSPKWVTAQWKKAKAFAALTKRAIREEARARGRKRTTANEPVRQKIVEVLKNAKRAMSAKEIAVLADEPESRVKNELHVSKAALVPRGVVQSWLEDGRRRYAVEPATSAPRAERLGSDGELETETADAKARRGPS